MENNCVLLITSMQTNQTWKDSNQSFPDVLDGLFFSFFFFLCVAFVKWF